MLLFDRMMGSDNSAYGHNMFSMAARHEYNCYAIPLCRIMHELYCMARYGSIGACILILEFGHGTG